MGLLYLFLLSNKRGKKYHKINYICKAIFSALLFIKVRRLVQAPRAGTAQSVQCLRLPVGRCQVRIAAKEKTFLSSPKRKDEILQLSYLHTQRTPRYFLAAKRPRFEAEHSPYHQVPKFQFRAAIPLLTPVTTARHWIQSIRTCVVRGAFKF